ncbi:MAG: DUF3553 domain-containing protein, partial [Nitrospirales bacterium]|nr:DUF3553 domain-containing protein [Nitrospirales bacterium]
IDKVRQRIETVPEPVNLVPAKPIQAYIIGSRVKHPAWGVGVVRDCSGHGDDAKVTVNFPGVGLKRLAAKFANLERI